jgi:hypothetical protein
MGLGSFDLISALHECPEFLAYISEEYSCYSGAALVGSPEFPVYQALESAVGFCFSGCVACVLSPETDIHGILNAKERVNKLLLDAFYRRVVCEVTGSPIYPANGPARTALWGEHLRVCASALGQDADEFTAELLLPTGRTSEKVVSVVSNSVTYSDEAIIFRVDWTPSSLPEARVRVRMES